MTRKELETRLSDLRGKRDDLQADADAASSYGTEDAALAVLGRAPARREFEPKKNEAELAKLDRDIAAYEKALLIVEAEDTAKALAERTRKLDNLRSLHRTNFIETVKAVMTLSKLIAEDRRLCNAVSDIEGSWIGSLSPSFPFGGWFNAFDHSSGLCYTIRDAINRGFLKGDEPFLNGVKWR